MHLSKGLAEGSDCALLNPVVGHLLSSFLGPLFGTLLRPFFSTKRGVCNNPLYSKRRLSKFQYCIAKSCESVSRLASTPSSKIAPMDCNQDLFPGPSTISITIQRLIQFRFQAIQISRLSTNTPLRLHATEATCATNCFHDVSRNGCMARITESSGLGRYKQDLKQCAMIQASQTA